MQDDRERIFGSIRCGLRSVEKFSANRSNRSPLRAAIASDFESSFRRFSSELAALGGEAFIFEDRSGICRFIFEHTTDSESIFIYDEIQSRHKAVVSEIRDSRVVRSSSEFGIGYDKNEISTFDSAISSCVACIAETGTVAINSDMRLPAALSTKLFIITDPLQLVPSLDELFTEKFRNFKGSNLFLITGPSRTADIEKELVTGVHGPKEVFVIFSQH